MLTHNDWFHWAPRIITKGFPLLNGNYKRQIDSKQLTSWVKQLSPQCSCGWWCRQEWARLLVFLFAQNAEINSPKGGWLKNEWMRGGIIIQFTVCFLFFFFFFFDQLSLFSLSANCSRLKARGNKSNSSPERRAQSDNPASEATRAQLNPNFIFSPPMTFSIIS